MKKWLMLPIVPIWISLALVFGLSMGLVASPRAAGPQALVTNLPLRTSNPGLLTEVLAGPGTYNSTPLPQTTTSFYCVFNLTADAGGSASLVFNLQYRVPSTASATTPTWVTLLSTAAQTTAGQYPLQLGKGVTTGTNVGLNVSLPAVIRAQLVSTGSSSTFSGTVDCDGS